MSSACFLSASCVAGLTALRLCHRGLQENLRLGCHRRFRLELLRLLDHLHDDRHHALEGLVSVDLDVLRGQGEDLVHVFGVA
jgi:hypothetical protein